MLILGNNLSKYKNDQRQDKYYNRISYFASIQTSLWQWVSFAFYILFSNFKFKTNHLRLFRMEALTHICQFYFPSIVHFENKLTNETIYDTFEDMAPNIDDTLMNCMWNDTQLSSTQLYSTILTEEGICFTFNALNSREIYTDRWHSKFFDLVISETIFSQSDVI